jgi:hypothetical protein
VPSDREVAFGLRVWDGIARETGKQPWYLSPTEIASHCPNCLTGTMRVTFLPTEPPRVVIESRRGGLGHCSNGCTEAEIAEALG